MFLDIAFGLLIGTHIAYAYFGGSFVVVLLGVVVTLLPDVDFAFHYLHLRYPQSRLFKTMSHRGIVHTPVFLAALMCLAWLLSIPMPFIALLLVGFCFHLMHDVFVLGRGVMVFYPLSQKRLKLFPDNGRGGYLPEKILWWDERETPIYTNGGKASMYSESWIADWYFRFNVFVVIETLIGIVIMAVIYSLYT